MGSIYKQEAGIGRYSRKNAKLFSNKRLCEEAFLTVKESGDHVRFD